MGVRNISAKTLKANKKHICNYCNLDILKKNKYLKTVIAYESQLFTWKSHIHCSDLAHKLKMFDNCDEGLTGEDFREFVNNEWHNIVNEDTFVPPFKDKLYTVLEYYKLKTDE